MHAYVCVELLIRIARNWQHVCSGGPTEIGSRVIRDSGLPMTGNQSSGKDTNISFVVGELCC